MRMRILLAGLFGLLMGPTSDLAAAKGAAGEGAKLPSAGEDAGSSPRRRVVSKGDGSPAAAKLGLLLDVNDYLYQSADGTPAGITSEEATILAARAEALVEDMGDGASEALAKLLAPLSPLDRTWTILCWTLSPRAALRIAVARAALRSSDGVGVYSALEVLGNDSDPDVRRAARTALSAAGLRTQIIAS